MAVTRILSPSKRTVKINEHSSYSLFRGNDGVAEMLASGGIGTSQELVKFVLSHFALGYKDVEAPAHFDMRPGCTAVQVKRSDGRGYLFGRNYDFEPHTMLILKNEPHDGYKSVSTVDTSFITGNFGKAGKFLPASVIKALALYLPVDGMNEKGFFCHVAIADAKGRCVAAEYIDDKLVINESPVVTNFYLEKGPKYGIGTEQSHIRYEKVMAHLAERSEMSADELRDELAGVAKSNFPDDFHTTEWSIVYDQKSLTATYYRREDYDHPWMVFI